MNQRRNVQYQVQSWQCKGIDGIECKNRLTNINSRKPKERCPSCQYQYRKKKNLELYYKRLRNKRLNKFLEGNV